MSYFANGFQKGPTKIILILASVTVPKGYQTHVSYTIIRHYIYYFLIHESVVMPGITNGNS